MMFDIGGMGFIDLQAIHNGIYTIESPKHHDSWVCLNSWVDGPLSVDCFL